MLPIKAVRPDMSWSWQNHQIVALTPDLCLSKTACTILVRQLYDTGSTKMFDPLLQFSTTISTTTDTIDTTALTMLTTTSTLLPMCYHD